MGNSGLSGTWKNKLKRHSKRHSKRPVKNIPVCQEEETDNETDIIRNQKDAVRGEGASNKPRCIGDSQTTNPAGSGVGTNENSAPHGAIEHEVKTDDEVDNTEHVSLGAKECDDKRDDIDVSPASMSKAAREEGNKHYAAAHKEGLAPVLKFDLLEKSLRCYAKALNHSTGNEDLGASSAKNYAKSAWAIAMIHSDIKQISYYFKEAIVHFCRALTAGSNVKTGAWVEGLQLSYRSCLDNILHSMDNKGYKNRCEAAEYYIRCMTSDLFKVDMYHELATLYFQRGVSALDEGDYKNSLHSLYECYTPKEEVKRLGRDRPDMLNEAMVLENDLVIQLASAEALQAIATGDGLLEEVIRNEESLNMDMIYDVIDWYKKAVILSAGIETEREAVANSRLGKLYLEILKMNSRSKDYLKHSIELALSLEPRNFAPEEWFRFATETLAKMREDSLQSQEEETQKEKQKYIDELKPELANIEKNRPTSEKDHPDFVKFIYTTFPPKKAEHKPPSLDEMKKMERKEMKKVLQTAVIHYHPDKANAETHGMKWKVLSEEITKELTRLYEGYKIAD